MNTCLNCAHAEWQKTVNGRVNPHKEGRCTWTKVIHGPLSSCSLPVELFGGPIRRKYPFRKCPSFQPMERV